MAELTAADTKTATEKKSKTAKTSAKTTTTKRKSPARKSSSATLEISAEQRQGMIAEVAYYKAEKRGFSGGSPVDDWLAAESEVDALLANNPSQQANA